MDQRLALAGSALVTLRVLFRGCMANQHTSAREKALISEAVAGLKNIGKGLRTHRVNAQKEIHTKDGSQLLAAGAITPEQASRLHSTGTMHNLADDAVKHARSYSTFMSARAVLDSLQRCRIDLEDFCDANHLIRYLQADNKRFIEVRGLTKAALTKLPAGTIIGYIDDKHGHVEIAVGNGKAASDFIRDLGKDSRQAIAFIPVKPGEKFTFNPQK